MSAVNLNLFNYPDSELFPIIENKTSSIEGFPAFETVSQLKNILSRNITSLNSEELQRALEHYFEEISEKALKMDPMEAVKELAEVLPLTELQDAIRVQFPRHKDAIISAKGMLESAKYFLDRVNVQHEPSLKAKLKDFLNTLLGIFETILSVFGVADVFKPGENSLQSDFKFNRVQSLIGLFTLLVSVLLPLFGILTGGAVVGGVLVLLAVLSLIYPLIKPAPRALPLGENLTAQAELRALQGAVGRKKILDDIARTLGASKDVKTHPMLIGETGVGKTETVKAFVVAVERGDYPSLVGKKVFYFDTSNLVNSKEQFGGGNRSLSKINEAMGRHREDIILVLDEIHTAFKKAEGNVIGEQLKTLLDRGQDKFPHVIGITTAKEYKDYIGTEDNRAFARRFKCISVGNTEISETVEILSSHLLKHAPQALIDKGVLRSIAEKSIASFPKEAQPAAAIRILLECIQYTESIQTLDSEITIDKLQAEKASFGSQAAIGSCESYLPYEEDVDERIVDIENKISELSIQLKAERAMLDKVQKSKDLLLQAKWKMFKSVEDINHLGQMALNKDSKASVEFLLLSHFMIPALENFIRKSAEDSALSIVITNDLVDRVIQKKLAAKQEAQDSAIEELAVSKDETIIMREAE